MEFEKSLEKLTKTAVKVLQKDGLHKNEKLQPKLLKKMNKNDRLKKLQSFATHDFVQSIEKEVNLSAFIEGRSVATKYDNVKNCQNFEYEQSAFSEKKFDCHHFQKSNTWPRNDHTECSDIPYFGTNTECENLSVSKCVNNSRFTFDYDNETSSYDNRNIISDHDVAKTQLAVEFLSLSKKNVNLADFLQVGQNGAKISNKTKEINNTISQNVQNNLNHNISNQNETKIEEKICDKNEIYPIESFDDQCDQNIDENFEDSNSFRSMKRMFSPVHSESGSILPKVNYDENDSIMWQSGGWLCKPEEYGASIDMIEPEDFLDVPIGMQYGSMRNYPMEFRKNL